VNRQLLRILHVERLTNGKDIQSDCLLPELEFIENLRSLRLSRIVRSKHIGSFKFRNSEQNQAFEFCHRSGILHGVLQFL
jgi:hypothetical protein